MQLKISFLGCCYSPKNKEAVDALLDAGAGTAAQRIWYKAKEMFSGK